jgi:hypothetical protein
MNRPKTEEIGKGGRDVMRDVQDVMRDVQDVMQDVQDGGMHFICTDHHIDRKSQVFALANVLI